MLMTFQLAPFDNEQDSLIFLNFLNNRHPNIKFTIEKQNNHSIAFLDVFISGINNQNLTLQIYHKSKISLIKCLIDRLLKICNNWTCFLMTQKTLNPIFTIQYPPFLINKVIKKYLDYKFFSNQDQLKDKSDIYHFKLPYIGNLSHYIKNKILKLCKEFCKEIFTLSQLFIHSKLKIIFPIKTQFLMI